MRGARRNTLYDIQRGGRSRLRHVVRRVDPRSHHDPLIHNAVAAGRLPRGDVEAPFVVTTPSGRSAFDPESNPESSPERTRPAEERDSGRPLIFCGMCGALNPADKFYCAACGTTLVDAFHATEGLRVYERPDSASRLVEIVPSGSELDVVEDPNASEDFVRVRLVSGKLGYIRLQEVDALATSGQARTAPPAPDINTNARGCVTPAASLGAIALVLVLGVLMPVIMMRSDTYDQGTMLLLFCVGLGPLLLLTVAIYLYARSRDDRLNAEEEDARAELASRDGNSA